jgi:hypothetical protein
MRRKLSPGIDLAQYSGLLTLNKKTSSSLNLKIIKPKTSFYEEITELCKKLDPDFKLEQEGANCYNLIKETIRKAVDLILKNDKMNTRDKITKLKTKNIEIKQINNTLLKEIQQWKDRETLLEKQEKHIKENEIRLQTEQKLFLNEKNFVNSTKKYYFQLENEIKDLKSRIKELEKMKNLQDFESKPYFIQSEDGLELEQKRIDSLLLQIKNEKKQLETQKFHFLSFSENPSIENFRIFMEKERENLEKDRKMIENDKRLIFTETQQLIKSKNDLKKQEDFLQKQKSDLENDQKLIKDIQINLSAIEFQLLEREKALQEKENSLKLEKNLNKKPSDFSNFSNLTNEEVELVLLDLQQQLEIVNKELTAKEERLVNWEASLREEEKSLQEKKEKKINLAISNPEKSSEIEKILQSLSRKNQELDKKIKENVEEFKLLSIVKSEVEEIFEKSLEERESFIENKILQVCSREQEIAQFVVLKGVDKSKRENAVEELRKERIRLENELMVKSKDLKLYSKLEKCVNRLESLINLLRNKEEEVNLLV